MKRAKGKLVIVPHEHLSIEWGACVYAYRVGTIGQIVLPDTGNILPPRDLIFKTFEMPIGKIKVVILGQDPFPTRGKACGRAFAYHSDCRLALTSSLLNILNEVDRTEGGKPLPNLQSWTNQGVFLLNTRLTVEEDSPMSHAGLGWETFTKSTVNAISEIRNHVVFLLWGREAQSYEKFIDKSKHTVLKASHPCKFSAHRSFIRCGHFAQANEQLEAWGMDPIDWTRKK